MTQQLTILNLSNVLLTYTIEGYRNCAGVFNVHTCV